MNDTNKSTPTTAAGCPVTDIQDTIPVGPRGPVLMQGVRLFEKWARFDRERAPERVVHAKGVAIEPSEVEWAAGASDRDRCGRSKHARQTIIQQYLLSP